MARVGKQIAKFSKPVITVFMALALVMCLGGVSVVTNLVNTTQASAKINYSAAVINRNVELDAANYKESATNKIFISLEDADYGYDVENAYAYYIMPISGKYYQIPLTHGGTTWEGSITLTTSMENGTWVFAGIGTESSVENDQFDNNALDVEDASFTLSGASDTASRPVYTLGSAKINNAVTSKDIPNVSLNGKFYVSAQFDAKDDSTGAAEPIAGQTYAYLRSPSNLTSKQIPLTKSGSVWQAEVTVTDDMPTGEWTLCVVQSIAEDGTIWTYNLALEDNGTTSKVNVAGTSGTKNAPTYTDGTAKAEITPIVKRDQKISLNASVESGEVGEVHAFYTKPVSGLSHEVVLTNNGTTWEGTIPQSELNEKGTWELSCIQMKTTNGNVSYVYDNVSGANLSSGDFVVNSPLTVEPIVTDWVYTGENLELEEGLQPVVRDEETGAAVVKGSDYSVKYKKYNESTKEYDTEVDHVVDAGKYVVEVEGLGDNLYKGNLFDLEFTVDKAKLELDAPESLEPTYSGKSENLISSITNTGAANIYYYTTTAANSAPTEKYQADNTTVASIWSESVPQDKDAGKYYIYYWAKGDSNHYDSEILSSVSIPVDIGEDPITRSYATINPKEIKVTPTVADKVYDGTNTATATIDSITGVDGETISFAPASPATAFDATFDSVNADERVHVTFNTTKTVTTGEGESATTKEESLIDVTVTGGQGKASNYTINYQTNKLYAKISQKEIEVKIPSYVANDKTYDGTNTATFASFDVSVDDVKNAMGASEQLTISGLEGTFASKDVKFGDKTGADGTKEIVDQEVTVTNKNNPTVVGIGTALASNYKVTLVDGDKIMAKITKADAVIRASQLSITVGGSDPALTATVTGLQNGETFTNSVDYKLTRTPTGSSVASSDTNKYYVVPTVIETDKVQNYNVKCVSTEFFIQAEQILVTEPTAKANLVYNGASQELINAGTTGTNSTLYYTINEKKPDSVSAISTITDASQASNIAATDPGTYSVYYGAVRSTDSEDTGVLGPVDNVKIAKKPITDTADATTASAKSNPITIEVGDVKYGATTNPKVTIKMKVGAGDDPSTKEEITLTEGTDYYVTYRDNDGVGTAKAVITGIGKFTGSTNQSYEVTANDAGAVVANQTMTYGKDVPALSAVFSGLQGDDTMVEDVDYDFKLYDDSGAKVTLSSELPVGEYKIQLNIYSNKKTKNYEFEKHIWDGTTTPASAEDGYTGSWITTEKYGRLTVEPDVLKVQAPTAKKLTYNGKAQELVNDDGKCTKGGTLRYKVSDTKPTTADADWSSSLPTSTNAGSYKVWCYAKADEASGYNDSEVVEVQTAAEIQKYTLKVSPTVASKTYDALTSGTASLDTATGVNGEVLTFTNASGGQLTNIPVTFSSPDVAHRVSATLNEGALSSAKFTVADASGSAITDGDKNYTITYNNSTLGAEITPKPITLYVPSSALDGATDTSHVGTKVYDGTTTAKVNSFDAKAETGESFTVRGVTATYEDANAGVEKTITANADSMKSATVVGLNGTKTSNYTVTVTTNPSDPLKGTITKAPATVTLGAGQKAYGEDDPKFNEKTSTTENPYVTNVEGLQGSDTFKVGTDFTIARVEGENVGTYTINGTAIADANVGKNYDITFVTALYTITKAKSSITTAPTGMGTLVYNTLYQDLITKGEADGGTVLYYTSDKKLSEDELKKLDTNLFTSKVPTQREVEYDSSNAVVTKYIYYYIKGDSNHVDLECFSETGFAPLETTLNPKNLGNTESPATENNVVVSPISDYEYTGSEIKPVPIVTYGDSELRNGSDFSITKYENNTAVTPDDATEAQKPTITLQGSGNYTGTTTVTFKINKIGLRVKVADKAIHYGDSLQMSDFNITFENAPNGLEFELNTDYSIQIYTTKTEGEELVDDQLVSGVPTDAGTYKVHFVPNKASTKMQNFTLSDDNFTVGTLTINKVDSQFDMHPGTIDGLVYNAFSQKLVTEGGCTGGQIMYAIGDTQPSTASTDSWSASVPEQTDAGNYNVYYYIKADNNHNDSTVMKLDTTIAKYSVEALIVPVGKEYDGNVDAKATAEDVYGAGDEVLSFKLSSGAVVYTSAHVADDPNPIVSENAASLIDATVNGGTINKIGNYDITYKIDDAVYQGDSRPTITAMPLNVAIPQSMVVASKEYDGTTVATINNYNYGTGVNSENVTISNINAAYDDKNVGENKRVSVTNADSVTIEGGGTTQVSDYSIVVSAKGLTSSIVKRTAIVSCDDKSITYGDELPEYTYTCEYFIEGETLTEGVDFDIETTATAKSSPGAYLLNPVVRSDSEIAKNYKVLANRGVLTIAQGNSYTVRFDSNGGDGVMDDQIVMRDTSTPLTKNTLTRDGYRFLGWTTDKFNKTASIEDQGNANNLTEQGGRITLYAVWQDASVEPVTLSNGYEVKFDANGGVGEMKSQLIEYGKATTLAKNVFTREGYTFQGWANEKDATTISASDSGVVTNLAEKGGSITLYAVWMQDTETPDDPSTAYTVLFDPNGGDGSMADLSVQVNAHKNLPGNLFRRDGYYFAGWSTNSNADDASLTDKHSIYNLAKAGTKITLYAVWKDRSQDPIDPTTNGYTVRFNANGGDGDMADQVVGVDQLTRLSSNVFTREGYTFVGWSPDSSSTSASLENNKQVQHLASAGQVYTLYAVWRANSDTTPSADKTCTVIFDANGGYGTMSNQVLEVETPTALSKCTFNRPGYTFMGWAKSPTASTASFADQYEVSNLADAQSTVTLYAVWESGTVKPVSPTEGFTIRFDANGGVGTMQDQVVERGVSTPLAANAYTRKGYTFLGWSMDYTDVNASYTDGARVNDLAESGKTVTLYAIWKDNSLEPVPEGDTYIVHFDPNGGSGQLNDLSVAADQSTQLPKNVYTFDNYQFVGWSTNASATSVNYEDQGEIYNIANKGERVTLYAIWKDISPNALAKQQSYNVYYSANGGVGCMANQEVESGTADRLSSNTFTRDGYTFQGWATSADATQAEYGNTQVIQDIAQSGENVKLYAVWESLNGEATSQPTVSTVSNGLTTKLTVNPGEAQGGTLMYGVSDTGNANDVSSWSEFAPAEVSSPNATVFYYVQGDQAHGNSPVQEAKLVTSNSGSNNVVESALSAGATPMKAAASMALGCVAVGVIALLVYANKRRSAKRDSL